MALPEQKRSGRAAFGKERSIIKLNRNIEQCVIKNSLHQSHEIISRVVKSGDTVVDATSGNGGDTVFLARLVGPEGHVWSFDIQQQALCKTLEKLKASGLDGNVTQICDSHANMDVYVNKPVKAVMFNLGYLPGGDHNIGTRGYSTITAIKKAMELIEINGLVTVVVYYGGDSGFEEKEEVLDFIRTIDCKRFTVSQTEFVNQINCPPILICIEKLR